MAASVAAPMSNHRVMGADSEMSVFSANG